MKVLVNLAVTDDAAIASFINDKKLNEYLLNGGDCLTTLGWRRTNGRRTANPEILLSSRGPGKSISILLICTSVEFSHY